MIEELRVGQVTAAPGEVARGYLPMKKLPPEAEIPIILINGKEEGPTLTILAGIHGFEYGGIAASMRVSTEVTPDQLKGQLVIAPIVNRTAFETRSIYVCPLDGKNLNREFPGDPEGTASQRIARCVYENLIFPADAVLDLHAGDAIEALVPFSIYHLSSDSEVNKRSLELAQAFGLSYVLGSAVPGSTYEAAAEAGVPAIIAEIGGQGIYDPGATDRHYEGIMNVMRHLGMLSGTPHAYQPPAKFYGFQWLRSDHDATFHPFCDVGDVVKEGQKVGEIRDYFGTVLQEAFAPASGPVLFLVTSLAIRNGDPLMGIADLDARPSVPES